MSEEETVNRFLNAVATKIGGNVAEDFENRYIAQQKEIERLNNIINELEKWAKEELEHPNWASCGARCMLEKLQELKGVDKE